MTAVVAEGERADVVIVGGGFAGLALAAVLGRAFGTSGRILVLDPAFGRAAVSDPNASAVAAGPRRLLETIGAWETLAPLAGPVTGMTITDSRLGDILRPVWLGFDGTLAEGEPFAHVVPNDAIRAALTEAARAAGAELRLLGYAGHELLPGAARITLGDGSTLTAPLLVAADGARSRVREAAKIRTHGWRYDQSAVVTTVRLARDHGGIATQHFLAGGPLAFLPLPQAHAGVVWTLPDAEARRLSALDDNGFRDALEVAAGHGFDGLELTGARAVRPLGLQVARRFTAERVALIGDAAHAIHPLAGQGLNLALKDVAALAELVVDAARLGADLGDGAHLDAYARWRRFDSLSMVAATEALARLFRGDRLRTLRDAGLGLFDRLGPVKRATIRAAAGLSGSAPKLLRGERL